jgi:hypothetical protein
MSSRTTRGNRIGLGIVGLLALASGGCLLARSFGAFGAGPVQEPVYTDPVATWIHQHSWIWIALAVVAVLIALLAVRWLLVQLRTERLGRVDIASARSTVGLELPAGSSILPASALTTAIGREIEDYPGIRSVRAFLTGAPDQPALHLKVVIDTDADVARVRQRIVGGAIANARLALDDPQLPAQLQLAVARPVTNRRTEL